MKKLSLKDTIKSLRKMGTKVFKREWIILPTGLIIKDNQICTGFAGYNLRTEKVTKEVHVRIDSNKENQANLIIKAQKEIILLMK